MRINIYHVFGNSSTIYSWRFKKKFYGDYSFIGKFVRSGMDIADITAPVWEYLSHKFIVNNRFLFSIKNFFFFFPGE